MKVLYKPFNNDNYVKAIASDDLACMGACLGRMIKFDNGEEKFSMGGVYVTKDNIDEKINELHNTLISLRENRNWLMNKEEV